MTDPFSITSGAAGVISLGLTVSRSLIDYYESYKSSGATVTAMCSQMEALASTLALLNKVVDHGYTQFDPEVVTRVEESIGNCREGMVKLERKLAKIQNASQQEDASGLRQQLGKHIQKAMFPFKESTLVKLREISMELRNELGFVLSVLQIDTSAISLQRLDGIDGKLDLIVEESTAASANILKFGQDIEAIGNILSGSQLDEERTRIYEWLRPPDPFANQDAARQKHEKLTNEWLLRSQEFAKWREAFNSLLMVYGTPGSGKTIIASSVIAEIEDTKSTLIYYYFDFNDRQKQSTSGCISSLLLQLALMMEDYESLRLLYVACDQGRRQPTIAEMERTLRNSLTAAPKVYIVLDALDECQDLDEVLGFIISFCGPQKININLLATSRKERNIDEAIDSLSPITINLQDELITQDIQVYVQRRLNTNPRLKKWCLDVHIKSEIEGTLVKGADGMFRWVVCQLDALQKCLTAASLKKTLRALPMTLYDTYDRILSNIDTAYHEEALQILRWLVVSQRPLFIEEAAEAVTILPTAGNGRPVFDADNRLSDPSDVFQICLSLVSTSRTMDSRSRNGQLIPAEYMRLAHYSVKEYLTSDAISWRPSFLFSINEPDAHVSISQACIAYLLNIKGRVSGSTSAKFPLAEYAAHFWNVHAELGSRSDGALVLEGLVIELLGSGRTMSNVYALCKPHYPAQSLTEKPALHWAVQYGLASVVAKILKMTADINMRDSSGRTALHIAVQFRRDSISRFLLGNGIDVNGQDSIGTALHYAVHTEDVSTVQMLLEAGANPNVRIGRRRTPIYLAAERNNLKMIKLLLDRSADPNASCELDEAGKMGLARESQDDVPESFKDRRYIGTPLQVAAWRGYPEVVATLLDSGAYIEDSQLLLLAQGKVEDALQALEKMGAYPYHFQNQLPDYKDIIRALQNHTGKARIKHPGIQTSTINPEKG